VNHIFATLATYAGYDARQWFLWTSPQRTRSPHSVAEVRIGSDWVVVDAWQGVLWTDRNGKLLGAQDATQELMDQLGYTRWGIKAEWFKYGTEFRSFPYETPVAFAEKIINKSTTVPVAPPVLPVSTPPSVSGSPVPATPTPSPGASLPTADDLQTYDEARRAQLDGDYGRAAELYQTVLGQSTSSELRDAAILWLGVSLLREGRAASAIEVFNTALATSPSTAWRTSILQFRGNAYEAIGNPEAAESDYITSDTPWSDTRLAKLGIKLLG
jgi:tetratricopeptide (TPR) repeat protein